VATKPILKEEKPAMRSLLLKGSRVLIGLLVFIILAAAPVMKYTVAATGRLDTRIFGPVIWIWERDWGEPYVWYFNSVWNCDVVMSTGAPPPWHSGPLFVLVILTALVFIFWPRLRRVYQTTVIGK
jgi:hypothetical protein